MDAAHLEFADSAFDYACAAMVLHEMPPDVRDRAVAEMVRVAGGGVLIIDYRRGGRLHWGTSLVESLEGSHALSYLGYPLEERLAGLGFEVNCRRHEG